MDDYSKTLQVSCTICCSSIPLNRLMFIHTMHVCLDCYSKHSSYSELLLPSSQRPVSDIELAHCVRVEPTRVVYSECNMCGAALSWSSRVINSSGSEGYVMIPNPDPKGPSIYACLNCHRRQQEAAKSKARTEILSVDDDKTKSEEEYRNTSYPA